MQKTDKLDCWLGKFSYIIGVGRECWSNCSLSIEGVGKVKVKVKVKSNQ